MCCGEVHRCDAARCSSPISLFVASCVMFLWRPIMEEVASALPISGAPYTYLSVTHAFATRAHSHDAAA